MNSSSDPGRERGQSNNTHRSFWALLRRRWFLKLLLVMAPLVTKVIELVILILKQTK